MGKTKRKNHSELEHLRGITREYEAEIRRLRKQLRQYEKYDRQDYSDEESKDSEDTFIKLKLTKECSICGKGTVIQTLEIQNKIYGTCNHCGFNERIK